MLIKNLQQKYPLIYEEALRCQVKDGNPENPDLKVDETHGNGGFIWAGNLSFWVAVNNSNFEVAQKLRPELFLEVGKWYEFDNPDYEDKSHEIPDYQDKNLYGDISLEKDWANATDEELLEEAKRRYPVGTIVHGLNNCGFSLKAKEEIKHPFSIDSRFGSIFQNGGLETRVYYKDINKWAEIVSKPTSKPEEKYKYEVVHCTTQEEWCDKFDHKPDVMAQIKENFDSLQAQLDTKYREQIHSINFNNPKSEDNEKDLKSSVKIDDNTINLVVQKSDTITLQKLESEISIKVNNSKTIKI
jgi:hypothetical protein